MKQYRIAVIPGDGIGQEVTGEAVKSLHAAADQAGYNLDLSEMGWGIRQWQETGRIVPEDFLQILGDFDAIYMGALGAPDILADHITLAPLIRIRQAFDQYICLRPAVLLPGIAPVLTKSEAIDFVVVRENSEGEYVGVGGNFRRDRPDEIAIQTAVHSRSGIERCLRFAFRLAEERKKKLTVATKSNALGYGMVLWDRVLSALTDEFSDVKAEKIHVDALSMRFVLAPDSLDVVVASNLFGDILSDLAGAITGSLGLAPSANINPEKIHPSLFEPVHGSAPDIAGRGIANPLAAIRSAGMMLEFLGESASGQIVDRAVRDCLREGKMRTPDLGGNSTTAQVGDDIEMRIRES